MIDRISAKLHDIFSDKPGFSRRDIPICREDDYQPFFIVGSGRSGSTLLRRILMQSGQIHIPPESYVLPDIIKAYTRNPNLLWSELVFLVLSSFEFHENFSYFNISLHPLVNKLLNIDPAKRSLSSILDHIYRYHAQECGSPTQRWADKTPVYVFQLPWIVGVFPRAKFVNIVRDGADVVVSICKVHKKSDLKSAANRWVNTNRSFQTFSKQHPDLCIDCRYEDLVLNPETEVTRMCDFLSLPYSQKMIEKPESIGNMGDAPALNHHTNVGKKITSGPIGKGRAELTTEQRIQLQNIMGPCLESLGYEPLQ